MSEVSTQHQDLINTPPAPSNQDRPAINESVFNPFK